MANFAMQLLMILMALLAFAGVPIAIVWGWVRWAKDSSRSTFWSKTSFFGFLLANASICVYIVSVVYAGMPGGFAQYAQLLMKMARIGSWLAFAGLMTSLIGCWRPSALRLFAAPAAVGAVCLWIIDAMLE